MFALFRILIYCFCWLLVCCTIMRALIEVCIVHTVRCKQPHSLPRSLCTRITIMQHYNCSVNETAQSHRIDGIIKVRIQIVRTMWITWYEERISGLPWDGRWRWWLHAKETVWCQAAKHLHKIVYMRFVFYPTLLSWPFRCVRRTDSTIVPKHCWLNKNSLIIRKKMQNGVVKMRQNVF